MADKNNLFGANPILNSAIDELKKNYQHIVAVQCIQVLRDFNDCREKGTKKERKRKSWAKSNSDELENYDKFRGCGEEYECYRECFTNYAKEIADTKDLKQLFSNPAFRLNKEKLIKILISEYEL